MRLQQSLQLFLAIENIGFPRAMAADPLHLRMGGVTRNEDNLPLRRTLRHDLMDFGDKGTGSIAAVDSPFPDSLDHGSRHAMCTYDEHSPLRYLAELIYNDDAALLQITDYLRVVNNRAEGIDCFPLFQHGIDQADRTVDAEAEARRFRQPYFLHGPSSQSSVIRSMIRREASRSSRVPPSSVMPNSS